MKLKFAAAVMVLLYGGACILAGACRGLAGKSSTDLVSYLNTSYDAQTSECVEYALRQLGERKYVAAIPVLIRYLDYRREPTASERGGGTNMHGWYPAAIALYEVGKPALPYLVNLLATRLSDVARRNALETVMDISSDDFVSGVRLIRSAAEKVRGNDSRLSEEEVRLTQASRDAAKMCPPRVRSDCEAALYGAAPKR